MAFSFQPWMKTVLIVAGIVLLIVMLLFLYLLVVGSDESRRGAFEPTQMIPNGPESGHKTEDKAV